MTRKANTVLFIIGATLFNIIVTIACFLLFLVIYSVFFLSRFSDGIMPWIIPVFFIASLVTSLFIYRIVMKLIIKRIDIDKHLAPLKQIF